MNNNFTAFWQSSLSVAVEDLLLKQKTSFTPEQVQTELHAYAADTDVAFSRDNYHHWSLLVDHKLSPGNTIPDSFNKKVDSLFLLVSNLVAPLVADDREKADNAAKVLWASLGQPARRLFSGNE